EGAGGPAVPEGRRTRGATSGLGSSMRELPNSRKWMRRAKPSNASRKCLPQLQMARTCSPCMRCRSWRLLPETSTIRCPAKRAACSFRMTIEGPSGMRGADHGPALRCVTHVRSEARAHADADHDRVEFGFAGLGAVHGDVGAAVQVARVGAGEHVLGEVEVHADRG